MDRRASHLIAALLLLLGSVSAHAGFAQLAPASVFSSGAGGAVMYKAAANDVISGGIARVAEGAALNIGGRAITVPVAARFAANAALFAARGSWPLLLAGLAAPVVIDWIQGRGVSVVNGVPSVAPANACLDSSGCTVYSINGSAGPWFPTQQAAYDSLIGTQHVAWFPNGPLGVVTKVPSGMIWVRFDRYGNGSFEEGPCCSAPGLSQKNVPMAGPNDMVPISQADFETRMAAAPLPDNVPPALPVPLPVQQPVINPDASPSPLPQPLWVPQGNPQPVPNTDPQQYRQPGTRITPAPSPSSPWQVDVAPDDKLSTSPSPVLDPQAVPPADAASAPKSGDPSDLCRLNPTILACQNLDTPSDVDLGSKDVPVSVTPDSGWGGGGSCPVARHLTVQGRDIPIPFDLFCQYMSGIRPVVLAMAWLSACFILVGAIRGDD